MGREDAEKELPECILFTVTDLIVTFRNLLDDYDDTPYI